MAEEETAPNPSPNPSPNPPQEAAPQEVKKEVGGQEKGGQEQEKKKKKKAVEKAEAKDGGAEKEKGEGGSKDLVLVEDPAEAAAFAALQEEVKAIVASIPAGAGTAFTASQLQELDQQSLVLRYMIGRVPVPTHLVFPIWKSVTGASSEGAQKYPTLMGLATLCLDFGKTPDAEPGRCRRTDGKKWRCWRNAIPNEKYCERHMHRGRKRPIQLVVEDDEPDAAAAAASASKSAPGKAAEGGKTAEDKSSSSGSAKKLSLPAPAAVEST